MSEMIERVAIAMAQHLLPGQADASVGDLEGTAFTYVDVGPLDMADLARLALQAMREPTEAMLRASEFLATGAARGDVIADYQAMIDQALQDEKEGGE